MVPPPDAGPGAGFAPSAGGRGRRQPDPGCGGGAAGSWARAHSRVGELGSRDRFRSLVLEDLRELAAHGPERREAEAELQAAIDAGDLVLLEAALAKARALRVSEEVLSGFGIRGWECEDCYYLLPSSRLQPRSRRCCEQLNPC